MVGAERSTREAGAGGCQETAAGGLSASLSESAAQAPSQASGRMRPEPARAPQSRAKAAARRPVPEPAPVRLSDEEDAELQRIADAMNKTTDISAFEITAKGALEAEPDRALTELAIIAQRLQNPVVRAQLETMVQRLAAEPAIQAAIGRRLTNAPVPATPVFQGREDDPRGAHGRVVDPVAYGQARDAVPPAPPFPAEGSETADPDPTLSGRPIEPGESAVDWGNENMDWFFGDAISRAQSQEALDRMIDRVRMEGGWGQTIGGKTAGDAPDFRVPTDRADRARFLRAQGANPDAEYKRAHRVPGEVVSAIKNDPNGLSGIQKKAYVIGPDGKLYIRHMDPSYTDPEGTLYRAREMQAHHSAKFDVPWNEALIDSADAEGPFGSFLERYGSILTDALKK